MEMSNDKKHSAKLLAVWFYDIIIVMVIFWVGVAKWLLSKMSH